MITIVPVPSTKKVDDAIAPMEKLLEELKYKPSSKKIFIKPNMVDEVKAKEAVDTDPNLIGSLILTMDKMYDVDEFVVGDGSAYFSSQEKNWNRLLKGTGYAKMVKKLVEKHEINVSLVNLEDADREEHKWKYGNIKLPKLCWTHAYINVAKMKTHLHTTVTLTLKNQKGLLSLPDKKLFHLGKKYGTLHESISALSKVVKPELAIIDATRALEGTGPATAPDGQTKVRELNLCLGGMDMMEVDNAACEIMGIPVGDVSHLQPIEVQTTQGSMKLAPAEPPFMRPKIEVKMWNIYRHTYETCCTGCQMSLSRVMRKILFVPELWEKFEQFQQKYPRADMIMGRVDPKKVEEIKAQNPDGPLIFFGNCTKKLAEQFGGIHIPNCSPDHNEAIEILFSLL